MFQGEPASKREIDAVMEVAVMTERLKSLILSRYGQHIEITDWIIWSVIAVQCNTSLGVEVSDLCDYLRCGFNAHKMEILENIMNRAVKVA